MICCTEVVSFRPLDSTEKNCIVLCLISFVCFLLLEEVCVNHMISYTDSCNCSDSSDIELNDDWVGKKSPKISRGSKSPKLPR